MIETDGHYVLGGERISVEKRDICGCHVTSTWSVLPPSRECCYAVEGVLKALLSLRQFVTELNWPDEGFAREIESVVQGTSVPRFKEAADL